MYETITVTAAEWGYLGALSDWSGGELPKRGKTRDGLHQARSQAFSGDKVAIGLPDTDPSLNGEAVVTPYAGYGYVRPWDEERESYKEWQLQNTYRSRKTSGRHDYYVGLKNGNPEPEAVGILYPERLFLHGYDEDGNHLPRHRVLEHATALIGKSDAHVERWDPVWVFHGIDKGDPTFDKALRAHTDYGISWYKFLQQAAAAALPPGYTWDQTGLQHGQLTFEAEE